MITVIDMVISARAANNLPDAANLPVMELRIGSSLNGGAFPFDNHDFSVNWHTHNMHQMSYAFEGAVEVQTPRARYLLPPQQAILLPAGLPHRTRFQQVRTVSVFFDRALLSTEEPRARILAASPVLREMILYSTRWRIDRVDLDESPEPGDESAVGANVWSGEVVPDQNSDRNRILANNYFSVLAGLVGEWSEAEQPLYLPTSNDPVVAAIMSFTHKNLADVSVQAVCAHVGISARSLRRTFGNEIAMTWRDYLQRARLLQSMILLSSPRMTVLRAANEVGFSSASAFARAFQQLTGESPSSYRRRALKE